MTERQDTTPTLPSIAEWKQDPDAATPPCPMCGTSLGITPDWLSRTRKDEWTCDYCGVVQ